MSVADPYRPGPRAVPQSTCMGPPVVSICHAAHAFSEMVPKKRSTIVPSNNIIPKNCRVSNCPKIIFVLTTTGYRLTMHGVRVVPTSLCKHVPRKNNRCAHKPITPQHREVNQPLPLYLLPSSSKQFGIKSENSPVPSLVKSCSIEGCARVRKLYSKSRHTRRQRSSGLWQETIER